MPRMVARMAMARVSQEPHPNLKLKQVRYLISYLNPPVSIEGCLTTVQVGWIVSSISLAHIISDIFLQLFKHCRKPNLTPSISLDRVSEHCLSPRNHFCFCIADG